MDSEALLAAMSPPIPATDMRGTKIALLVGSLGLAACVSAWFFLRAQPLEPSVFKRPLHVVGARAMPDGGTLEIRFADADGKALLARRVGSLAVEPSRQELRVVTYLWLVPVERDAPWGSPIEALVKEALRVWLSDRISAEQKVGLENKNQDALRSISFDVVASYDLASWLDRRR